MVRGGRIPPVSALGVLSTFFSRHQSVPILLYREYFFRKELYSDFHTTLRPSVCFSCKVFSRLTRHPLFNSIIRISSSPLSVCRSLSFKFTHLLLFEHFHPTSILCLTVWVNPVSFRGLPFYDVSRVHTQGLSHSRNETTCRHSEESRSQNRTQLNSSTIISGVVTNKAPTYCIACIIVPRTNTSEFTIDYNEW